MDSLTSKLWKSSGKPSGKPCLFLVHFFVQISPSQIFSAKLPIFPHLIPSKLTPFSTLKSPLYLPNLFHFYTNPITTTINK